MKNLNIEQVANGWVVRQREAIYENTPSRQTWVFRTVVELAAWLLETLNEPT